MLNKYGGQGWEFVRAEVLDFQEKGGMFSKGAKGEETYFIFRRSRVTVHRSTATQDEPEEQVEDGGPRLGGAFRD